MMNADALYLVRSQSFFVLVKSTPWSLQYLVKKYHTANRRTKLDVFTICNALS